MMIDDDFYTIRPVASSSMAQELQAEVEEKGPKGWWEL